MKDKKKKKFKKLPHDYAMFLACIYKVNKYKG